MLLFIIFLQIQNNVINSKQRLKTLVDNKISKLTLISDLNILYPEYIKHHWKFYFLLLAQSTRKKM